MPPAPLGILGGSFNPPHLGHLVIASDAHFQLELERVLFMPAKSPPHKQVAGGVSAAARLAMTRFAVVDDDRFAVSSLEIDQGFSYTVDMLRYLRAAEPDRDLVFIVGSDSLLQFSSWYRPAEILTLCRLAVAPRPGDSAQAIARAVASWPEGAVVVLDSTQVAVSSSALRKRARRQAPLRYLVPAAVENFIREQRLYAP
ncbi:MAG: nicotinate-nucleotide adenylyltransferase [Thermoleophilia bacterium]